MQTLLLALAVTLLASTAQGAEAAPFKGKCLLEVNGRTYIRGPCKIYLDSQGRLSEISAPGKEITYFAQVFVDGQTAWGAWNQYRGTTRAHAHLGTLTRNAACWSNQKAKVCAWR